MTKLIPNTFNLAVIIYVAFGSTACSYGMAVLSTIIGQPSFYTSFHLIQGTSHTSNLIGALNGLTSAGSGLGAALCAWTADRFGRKWSIQVGAVGVVVGAALCAGSVDMGMFLVGRGVVGLGVGMLITAIPMYQAECSTPESRGFMVSMHGIMFAIGYSLSSWIGFGCFFISASGSQSTFPWRFPLAFQAFPPLLVLAGSPWLPSSPRWLLQQNRTTEAFDVIRRLHRSKADPDDITSKREFFQMQKQLELDRARSAKSKSRGIFELFETRGNRKRAAIGFLLMFCNMFTGTLVIFNYGILLYESLGFKTFTPLLLTALFTSLTFPGNIFCSLHIDRFGRRKFLLTGLTGILISLIGECIMQALFLHTPNKAGQRAAVFFIASFTFFWSFFVDATQYLYVSEIFPTHLRAHGMSFSLIGYFSGNLILLVAGPIALQKITWRFFLVFIFVTGAHLGLAVFWYPETKQRSLEDVGHIFGDEVAVWYYGADERDDEIMFEGVGGRGGVVLGEAKIVKDDGALPEVEEIEG